MLADLSPAELVSEFEGGDASCFDYTRLKSDLSMGLIAKLMGAASDPFLLIDRDGRIVTASAALCVALSIRPRDLPGKLWYEAVVPEHEQDRAREFSRAVLAGETDPSKSWTSRTEVGHDRKVTITWRCFPPSEDAGENSLAVLFGRALTTDSDRVKHHLHELQVKYQSIVDNIATGVAVISPSFQILKLNRQMQNWFPHVRAVDKPICYQAYNTPPFDSPCPWCPVKKTLKDGHVHESITETPTPDGLRNYQIISSPLTDEAGEVTAVIEMVTDVTDQLRAEEAIRESEERIRTVVDASMDAIIACDCHGRITLYNPAAEKMFGHKADEMIGSAFDPLLPEGMVDRHREMVKSYFTTGEPNAAIDQVTELTARRSDGSHFPIELTLSVAHHGPQATAVAMIRDITDRRAAQDALHELATQYSTMMDAVPVMVYVKDKDRRFTAVNQAFRSYCNKSDGEILGKTSQEVLPKADVESCEDGDEEVFRTRKRVSREARRFVGPSGTRWMSTTKVPLIDPEGNVSGLVGLVQDVTEAHQSREQLIQADKLAAIGTLAAGVAHEINNPIGFISSNLNTMGKYLTKIQTMLGDRMDAGSPDSSALTTILEDFSDAIEESIEGSERVKGIVADLKSFSRVDRSEAEYASINDGINSTLNIVWNELKYKCTVEKDLGELPDIYCRLNQLNQVFMNILINAGHAIEKGEKGVIKIKTWADDQALYVSIKDNGRGISPDNVKKIFEPFYTTKEVGKGTGLGLSLAYDIVSKHGGNIDVNSRVGEGTEFIVTLPFGGLTDE